MVAGHLQEKKGYWYLVITFKQNNKPTSKWFSTGLKVKGNKRKAEGLLTLKRIEYTQLLNDGINQEVLTSYETRCVKTKKLKIESGKNSEQGMMFGELCMRWLEHKKPQVRETTFSGYNIAIKTHIIKYANKNPCRAKNVDSAYVQKYIDYLYKKGLSHKTIKNHRGILSNIFKYGMVLKEMRFNPMLEMEPATKTPPVENYFGAEELKRVLNTVTGTVLEYPVYMACVYGLRRAEIMGLKWDAVDFTNNIITIRHTVTEMNTAEGKTKLIIKDTTKNEKAKSFPLLKEIEELLIKMKTLQKKNGFYNEHGYIALDADGKLVRPNYITIKFKKHLEQNGFKHIRFHDLRHSCASVLLSDSKRTVSLKDIQLWLGHSDIESTMRYAHISDIQAKQQTAELMESIIFSK